MINKKMLESSSINYKNRAIMTVAIPLVTIATDEMAPALALISTAFDVPTACDVPPSDIPTAGERLMCNSFKMSGPNKAPKIPVKMTADTVIPLIPPSFSDTSNAMGVVTDLGINDIIMFSSNPSKCPNKSTLPIETLAPTIVPTTMGSQ